MKIRHVDVPLTVLSALIACAYANGAVLGLSEQDADVIVAYSVQDAAVGLQEPVFVEARIENHGTEGVIADLGADFKKHFVVTVTTPGGAMTPPLMLEEGGIALVGRVPIDHGGKHVARLLLNEWYEFTEVGTYNIRIELKDGLKTPAGADLDIRTEGTVEVHVTPRDEGRLRVLCDSLATTIENEGSAQAMLDAARALKYVRDPIAVPYLRRVLARTTWVDWILIDGLARIGNDEARDALAAAAKESGERADMARGALIRLRRLP